MYMNINNKRLNIETLKIQIYAVVEKIKKAKTHVLSNIR